MRPTQSAPNATTFLARAKSEAMRAWEHDGFAARDLASHLLDVSSGVKSGAENLQEYRTRMSLAIRIICARG